MTASPMTRTGEEPARFLRDVRIRNYKSIGKCDVHLGAMTLLVGRNGSGKSNFLDALRFVSDALKAPIEFALKTRGGIDAVRRISTGHPRNFAIEMEVQLPHGQLGSYGFEVAAKPRGGFAIRRERAEIRGGISRGTYTVENGQVVEASEKSMPPGFSDRLYLPNAAGLPAFRDLFDSLSSMGFYNLNPEAMKEFQNPDAGELLHRDGSNIASVVARLTNDKLEIMQRIDQFLASIVPGVTGAERVSLGPRETLLFRQKIEGSAHPWKFYASNMSDGTLRAFGTLVAVMQLAERRSAVSVVGIEEPETALHPAAAGALMDALREAATHTQVIITTHSPDLLDQVDPDRETLLAVILEEGRTIIASMDEASREAIRKHLFTPGELFRLDQLEPDRASLRRQTKLKFWVDEGRDEPPAGSPHR